MNAYKKLSEEIYTEMLSFKASGSTLKEIEKAEDKLRKQCIAVLRVAIINHDNKLKASIFRNVTAFLLGYNGKRYGRLEKSIQTSIMRTTAEDHDEKQS